MSEVKIDIKVITGSATATVKRFAGQLEEIEDSAKGAARTSAKAFNTIGGSAKRAGDTVSKALGGASDVFKIFLGNLAANAVSAAFRGITSAFTGAASTALSTARTFEDLNTRLVTLTGSTEDANELFSELRDFAAVTPFQLEGITDAAAQLLAFGTSIEDITPRLKNLGDVSAASGADLGEVALIFGQIQAAGKLTGERLLQLQERAIPIGPAIAETLGIAESQLRDFVKAGKVSAEEVGAAFELLSQEGQFAFNGLARASLTFNGAVSTLQENAQFLVTRFAEVITGSGQVKASIAGLSAVFEVLEAVVVENQASLQGFVDNIANAIPAAISFLGETIFVTIATFNDLRQAYNTTVGTGALVISTFVSVAEAALTAARAVASFTGSDTSGIDSGLESLAEFQDSLNETADTAADSNQKIQQSTNSAFNTISTVTAKSIEAFNTTKAATLELAAAQEEADRKRVESRKASNEAIVAADAQLLALQQEAALQASIDKELEREAEVLFREQRLIDLEEFFTRVEEAEIQARLNSATGEEEKQKILLQAQIEGNKRRRAEVNKLTKFEKLNEEEKNQFLLQNTSKAFGALAGLAATGGEKLFKVTKALQTAQVITGGIAAIQLAASAAPFPANIPGIVVETARAATSLIQINRAQPRFQDGGIVGGGQFSGDQVTARVNSGEMILNRQQQAQLFELATGSSGQGGKEIIVNSTIELDGEAVGRSVSRQVADGLELGEVV